VVAAGPALLAQVFIRYTYRSERLEENFTLSISIACLSACLVLTCHGGVSVLSFGKEGEWEWRLESDPLRLPMATAGGWSMDHGLAHGDRYAHNEPSRQRLMTQSHSNPITHSHDTMFQQKVDAFAASQGLACMHDRCRYTHHR
jgi:hypothetical protein